jgi:hypothetical protein
LVPTEIARLLGISRNTPPTAARISLRRRCAVPQPFADLDRTPRSARALTECRGISGDATGRY